MTEHQKHVAIGVAVAIAGGVLIWYLLTNNTTTPVSTNAADTAPDAGNANPGALPSYVSYNIPPAYPGGSITNPSSDSCCRDCAGGSGTGGNSGVNTNLNNWYAYGGNSLVSIGTESAIG